MGLDLVGGNDFWDFVFGAFFKSAHFKSFKNIVVTFPANPF